MLQCLIRCKEETCAALGLDPKTFELSMGMSHDFEHAVSNYIISMILDLYVNDYYL